MMEIRKHCRLLGHVLTLYSLLAPQGPVRQCSPVRWESIVTSRISVNRKSFPTYLATDALMQIIVAPDDLTEAGYFNEASPAQSFCNASEWALTFFSHGRALAVAGLIRLQTTRYSRIQSQICFPARSSYTLFAMGAERFIQ